MPCGEPRGTGRYSLGIINSAQRGNDMSTFNTSAGIRPFTPTSSSDFRAPRNAASNASRPQVPQLLQASARGFPSSVFSLALEDIEAITKKAGLPANAASVDAVCQALRQAVETAQSSGLGNRRMQYLAARANAVIENIVMRMPHLAGAVSLVTLGDRALSFRSAGFCKAMDRILTLVRQTPPPYTTQSCQDVLARVLDEYGHAEGMRKDELSALLGAVEVLTTARFTMSRSDGEVRPGKFDLDYCPGDVPGFIPDERQELLRLLESPVFHVEEASSLVPAIRENLLEVLKGAVLDGASGPQVDELLRTVDSWFAEKGVLRAGPVASDPAALLGGLSPIAIGALRDAGVGNAQGYPKPTAAELFASPARVW